MKSQNVIRQILKSIQDNDIVICTGEKICKEVFKYHKTGYLYLSKENALSFAIGVANGTDKKLFLLCDDNYALRNLDVFLQAASSRCSNLFVVVLITGCYDEIKYMPNIISNVSNMSGLFFSMGFIVHDYTKKLLKKDYKEIEATWTRARGPLVAFVYVEPGYSSNLPDLDLNLEKNLLEFSDFVKNKQLGTSMFIPPLPLDDNMVLLEEK